MNDSLKPLEEEYRKAVQKAQEFSETMVEQLTQILKDNRIPLGVEIENRVKSWRSIEGKIERKAMDIDQILALDDLVGLRLLLLFKRDVGQVCGLISSKFNVIHMEDKLTDLGERQFGYQSIHFIVTLPDDWLSAPTLSKFKGLKAEIQIRTLAQHIWAAASHVLQYKIESNVPMPIRRSINRVSALLETVDLEFERVLDEKEEYLAKEVYPSDTDFLNVDLLQKVLDEVLPPENKSQNGEDYSSLLAVIDYFKILTVAELKDLISNNIEEVMKHDVEHAKGPLASEYYPDRAARGVYFTHVGLAKKCLMVQFGEEKIGEYLEIQEKGSAQ